MIVSFTDYKPPARYDGLPWVRVLIEESADGVSGWSLIDNIAFDVPDPDPAEPMERSFSTTHATLANGWYRVSYQDLALNREYTEPVQYAPVEILASLDDINAQLDDDIITADLNDTALLQTSIARIIRANLSQVVGTSTLYSWSTPGLTPEVIREIAAKLIAGRLYIQKVSRSGQLIPNEHYGQILYQEGLDMLKRVMTGEIAIIDIPTDTTASDSITDLDYFPRDATDRAFTLGMEL